MQVAAPATAVKATMALTATQALSGIASGILVIFNTPTVAGAAIAGVISYGAYRSVRLLTTQPDAGSPVDRITKPMETLDRLVRSVGLLASGLLAFHGSKYCEELNFSSVCTISTNAVAPVFLIGSVYYGLWPKINVDLKK